MPFTKETAYDCLYFDASVGVYGNAFPGYSGRCFLIKKKSGSRSKRVFGLLFLTMVMSVSVTLFEDIVAL